MKNKDHGLEYRRYVIGGVAILIVVIYTIRLFTLQITSDDYKKSADSNAFLKKIEYPSRGVISDRNGKLMVYNQPSYDIMVVMNEIKDRLDTLVYFLYFKNLFNLFESKLHVFQKGTDHADSHHICKKYK